MITETQIAEMIAGAQEQIKAAVIEKATASACYTAQNVVANEIQETLKKWIKENIVPELFNTLDAQKPVLIEAAVVAAHNMAAQISKVMTEKLGETLATSYRRTELLKAMFGG